MTQKDKTETDKKIKKVKRLAGKAIGLNALGKLSESMEVINQGDELIRSFQGNVPKELEGPHCFLLSTKISISLNRGFLELVLKLNNEYLAIAKKYGNKTHIAIATSMYAMYYDNIGNLNEAFVQINNAITLMEECFNTDDSFSLYFLAEAHYAVICITIEMNELERAKNYFKRLEEILELKPNDPPIRSLYQLTKAHLLQSSKRARDRVKAEELYKDVIETEITPSFTLTNALIGRCELLLIELKLTEEIEIIDEIKILLNDLVELAQQRESDALLMSVYILQGKLALLTYDMQTARRFLVQGQRIAERRGYKSTADEIAILHEDLIRRLDEWERLKKKNAPLSERIKLIRLNESINKQFDKRIMNMEQIIEKEVTVYKDLKSCIVCKGSAEGFNIYVCPKCNSIYCRGCAKAVIELENACWTCDLPIDKEKPSQFFEKKEEKIISEEKDSKKAPKSDLK